MILLARFIGFAVCMAIYLLMIDRSRRHPALVSFATVPAMLAGLLLFGHY